MNELRDIRKTIDKIDLKILELLKQRLTLSKEIGEIKNNLKLPIEDYERELAIRKKVREYARHIDLEPQELDNLFLQIISVSKKVQGNNVKVAFLGPQGTFCEQAARRFFLHKPVAYVARPSIQDIFRSVEWDNYNYGVVPVENSIEGSVTITLDMFLETEVKICGEIQERIHHNLITKPQLTFDNIRTLISHPQAVAQCIKFIETNLPETKILEANSTAKAVQKVKTVKHSAAIGTELSAQIYGLEIIAKGIEDFPNNFTRFIVLSKTDSKPSVNDKTSIIFSIPHTPGSLHKLLGIFSKRKINLTKIESRPSRQGSWEYYFYCDFEGHRLNKSNAQALEEFEKNCTFLKILGSYPKA